MSALQCAIDDGAGTDATAAVLPIEHDVHEYVEVQNDFPHFGAPQITARPCLARGL